MNEDDYLVMKDLKKDDLPVKTKLAKLNIHDDARCILCLDEEETLHHLFLTCPLSTVIWFGSS